MKTRSILILTLPLIILIIIPLIEGYFGIWVPFLYIAGIMFARIGASKRFVFLTIMMAIFLAFLFDPYGMGSRFWELAVILEVLAFGFAYFLTRGLI